MPWYHFIPEFLYIIASRYYILSGLAFVICYVLLRKRIARWKIQLRYPSKSDYLREVIFSTISILIFTSMALVWLLSPLKEYTQRYKNLEDYGLTWYILAFPIMFLIHDAYFYWTHRLMHHPRLFKVFHLLHHKSTNPSPWTAFAFHPAEALLEASILPVLLIIMPITTWHLTIFFLVQMIFNVYAHLGWELYPKWFSRQKIGRWMNTSINHNQHHQHFKGNYGLYFLWWDRWFGTIREDYETKYEEVKNR